MYLLYEHFKSASGEILATDMLLTSRFPGSPFISFRDANEKALFEFCKLIFKSIHTKNRTIDMNTYIWSFLGSAGKDVYDKIKASPIVAAGLLFERVEDLKGQKAAGFIHRPDTSRIDPSDFFYQQAAPASAKILTRSEIAAKLAPMLQLTAPTIEAADLSILKKEYRRAALRLHPDRNNGDATQMTELNWLWQQLQPTQSAGA